MSILYFDRVKETTTTTGTGAVSLGGAETGYQAFGAVLTTSQQCWYCIADQGGANWEVGIGTYTTSGNTLTRSVVFASSNSGAAVSFTAGTKDVFMDVSAYLITQLVGPQTANYSFLAPNGVSGAPGFRAILPADLVTAPPPGYIYGLGLNYVSSTSLSVDAGQCADSTGAYMIPTPSFGTISTGTSGVNGGVDSLAIAGTVTTSTANATVTGSSTSFLTSFNPIALTGTFSSSSTTLTQTGGVPFCLAVGDMFGNSSKGYFRVTAVASGGLSYTLVSAPGTAFSSDSGSRIENAWAQVNSQTVRQINTITTNTNLTLSANNSANASGGTFAFGVMPVGQVAMHAWVGTDAGSTLTFISSQRTAPLNTGTVQYYRRIGSVIWGGTSILPFSQIGSGPDRTYQFLTDLASNTYGTQLVTNGAATSKTTVVASSVAPPTATFFLLSVQQNTATGTYTVSVRPRGLGDGTAANYANRVLWSSAPSSAVSFSACDGAQCLEYLVTSGGVANIYMGGYQESL
jgi:hypothetical protein